MVVVRESPHATHSPHKNTAQWPPRSPFQALLSSPGGRRKWQDRRAGNDARSVSPSPTKLSMAGRTLPVDGELNDEEDDEEMLQLKLQAIEAKLKLKKLQNAKRGVDEGDAGDNNTQSSLRSIQSDRKLPRPKLPQSQVAGPHETVEIPLSPSKGRLLQSKEQRSPARARLGLGATLKADGVSLKRARDGTQLRTSESRSTDVFQQATSDLPKPSSFSERLAQSKSDAQWERDRKDRVENARSAGFARSGQNTPRSFVSVVTSTPIRCEVPQQSSAVHRLGTSNTPIRSSGVARSASMRAGNSSKHNVSRANGISSSPDTNGAASRSRPALDNIKPSLPSGNETTTGYDPFTELHLSKRHIPHVDVAREMADKEVYTLVDLLKEVKAPCYEPPDCERDYVVFAVLASKSQPFDQKQANRTSDENKPQEDADKPRNKFMVLHLTDLKWEVDLFLFGTAFDQFWKLTPGTLIAILNPATMPPKGNQHSGRFSMKLGSSDDCVMEIGVARDLGYCASVKKDGQTCGTWIDKRKTEVCDFHLDMMINRERKGRMEVNTMWRSHQDRDTSLSPPGRKRGPRSFSSAAGGFDKQLGKDKYKSHHPEYGRLYSIPGGGSKSAANLLDAEDSIQQRMDAQEASRRRIAAAQRERDLAKRLGEMGRGVGAEYMRAQSAMNGNATTRTPTGGGGDDDAAAAKAALFDKPSAAELGLLANKAEHQHLSPAKDRKRHFGLGALSKTNGGADAIGWGGARKAGLLQHQEARPGSPEKGQTTLQNTARSGGGGKTGIVRARSIDGSATGSVSPSKKRARFALEKGIREPGRESLGEMFKRAAGQDGDDDDDLDIV